MKSETAAFSSPLNVENMRSIANSIVHYYWHRSVPETHSVAPRIWIDSRVYVVSWVLLVRRHRCLQDVAVWWCAVIASPRRGGAEWVTWPAVGLRSACVIANHEMAWFPVWPPPISYLYTNSLGRGLISLTEPRSAGNSKRRSNSARQ